MKVMVKSVIRYLHVVILHIKLIALCNLCDKCSVRHNALLIVRQGTHIHVHVDWVEFTILDLVEAEKMTLSEVVLTFWQWLYYYN
jgi:hypothetical protein